MSQSKNVLFCYITRSSGHQRAAEAVMNALRHMNPHVQSHGINSISYSNPILGRLVSRAYLNILKHAPRVWDFLYDNPHIEEATRDVREVLNILSAGKVYRIFDYYKPRCLVCTQAVPMTVLATLKQRGKIHIPLVGIITDFGVHSYWISKAVDLYLAPTEEIKRRLTRQGIKESRVLVTGIPLDPSFSVRGEKKTERARLGLSIDGPIVLVMGGSRGLGPLSDVVHALRKLPFRIQVVAVCGENRKLLKEMHEKFSGDSAVKVFGHTKNIPRFMDAADLLISKPGGLTSSEALAKGLPFLMIQPIPGQEERNAAYLQRHGAAERVETLEDLVHKVRDLFTHKDKLAKLRAKSLALAKPMAAFDAAQAILKMIHEPVLTRPALSAAVGFISRGGE